MTGSMVRWWSGAAALLPLLTAACGGDGAGAGTVTVVTAPPAAPTPTPAPTAISAPTPTPPVTVPADWAAGAAALFAAQPDVPDCRPGVLAASVRADVLLRLNAIRALHRLPAVTYSDADDEQAMQAALMMAANGRLSHTPPANWACYTATGSYGAGSSNLYGGLISPFLAYYSEDMYLAGWLTETTNVVANNVGHRRWMLDPFLGKIAYGRVAQVLPDGRRTDAATMKVMNFAGGTSVPAALPAYVAYPYGDYPARYFDPAALLSFSVVADATTRGGANASVNFSNATVSVRSANAELSVTNVSFDNTGYGLPNNIQFAVPGLRNGIGYEVTVANVLVRGTATRYTYAFRIVP